MWMCFDSTRNMRVLTAFGLTEGFTPECGAWGQGAVEAPIGWLGFMSWMSAYVETKASRPYIYGRGEHKISLNKVIYADDGTYLASSRKGAQRILNAVADFATATGIMIKPAKSYTYSNRPGDPLTVTTYEKSNTKFKLRNKIVTKLDELDETHYFRHLGNVQNAQGHTPTEPTILYDGSTQDNILTKVRKSMAALAARNITVGGVMQVLQAVVVRQILYPTTFGNMGDKELNVIQNKMEEVIKKKLRYPRHMKNVVLYGHEQAGGIGLDHIQTLVNTNRLILLMNCLSQGGEMEKIMIGAVQRLQEYACTEQCPLETKVTGYTKPRTDMWLYTLKQWMEQNNITVTWPYSGDNTCTTGIMDVCTKETRRNEIWAWVRQTGLKTVSDLMYPDGTWREHMLPAGISANIKGQITSQSRTHAIVMLQHATVGTGRWVKRKMGETIGKVIRRPGSRNKAPSRKHLRVEVWSRAGRTWIRTGTAWWRKTTAKEVKVVTHGTDVVAAIEINDKQVEEHEHVEPQPLTNVGLYNYYADSETMEDLRLRGEVDTQTMWVASDGSVLDSHTGGTWAWHLLNKIGEKYTRWGVEAVGVEWLGKAVIQMEGPPPLDTLQSHSYRTEALAVLSGLTFLRVELEWKGTVEWHTDSQAVIDTSGTVHWYNMTKWVKQRDKDVWVALRMELKRWEGRLKFHHVESHTDKKKDEQGNKRKVTPIEEMNQYADWLADWAYTADIKVLEASTLECDGKPTIHMAGQLVSGNWRTQIQEEIRLNNSKQLASKDPDNWGICPEDIAWHRMVGTSKKTSIYDRMKTAQIMHGRRTTKDLLYKFDLIDEPTCDMCGEAIETNEHVLCHCTGNQCSRAKRMVADMMVEAVKRHGGDECLMGIMASLYSTDDRGAAINREAHCSLESDTVTISNCPDSWSAAFGTKAATYDHVAHARAYEHLLRLGGNQPVWTGVITKPLLYLMKWGNIKDERLTSMFKEFRCVLHAHAKVVWRNRCETVYSPENEKRRLLVKKHKEACEIVIEAKAAGYITAAEVMQMSPIQKARLKHAHIGGWQDQWSQQKISQMFAPAAEQNTLIRARLTRPAHIVTMPRKTQRTLSSAGSLGPEAEASIDKKEKAGNKKKNDNNQLTLQESWNLPEASTAKTRVPNCVGKKRKAERNTSPHKRRRGNRKNTCHKCKLRGALIECHTCLNSCHIQCTETMPDNVKDPKVVWRCEDCHEKKGSTNCSFSKWVEGLKHTTAMVDTAAWSTRHQAVGWEVQKQFGQQVYQGRITKWLPGSKDEWELWKIVYEDEDSEDVDTHELVRMLKVPANKTEQKPAGVDIMQAGTKEEDINETLEDRTGEQNNGKTLQARKPITDSGQRTRKNVDHTKRNRKKKSKTEGQIQDHDTMPNGQTAGRIHATNTELVKFLADIRGVTNGTLEDGHCLRRALGKLWGMQPGQVIRKIREGGEHLRLHRGKPRIESDDKWYKSICDRPSEWDNIQLNKNSHCSREE